MLYLYTCADLALSSNAVATLKMQYVFAASHIGTSNRPEYLKATAMLSLPQ
jgi:hypothetical protein